MMGEISSDLRINQLRDWGLKLMVTMEALVVGKSGLEPRPDNDFLGEKDRSLNRIKNTATKLFIWQINGC